MPRSAQGQVRGDEIRLGDAVAVGEQQIVGPRRQNRLVQDAAFLKAFVRMPDVVQRQPQRLANRLRFLSRLGFGPIVGDDDFEPAIGLVGKSPEAFFQPIRLVIGADDDGGFVAFSHV